MLLQMSRIDSTHNFSSRGTTHLPPLSSEGSEVYQRRNYSGQHQSTITKKNAEVTRQDPPISCVSSDPLLRISQLEQNIRFLQEQHQVMLSSLHQEIENLRSRNRDLQFQVIFGKNGIPVAQSSSDSSPEDTGKPKIVLTPKEINTRSLHVEMLEREVSELKTSLTEANTKNANLTQVVEHQKKQLESTKKEIAENDYVTRLDEADVYIKIVLQENEELRKEIASLRTQLSKAGSNSRYNGGQGGRRGGNGEHSNHQHFPPLQSQSYWGSNTQRHRSRDDILFGGRNIISTMDWPFARNIGQLNPLPKMKGTINAKFFPLSPEYRGRRVQMEHEVTGQAAPTLPHLTRAYSQNSTHNRPRYYSNGNHFYRGNTVDESEGRRKHRGRGSGNNREGNQ